MEIYSTILFCLFFFGGWGACSSLGKERFQLLAEASAALDGGANEPATPLTRNDSPVPPFEVVHLEPLYFPEKNSKRTQIKYGPYPVEPMSRTNGMRDYEQVFTTMPCHNCTITYMAASLEYPDGSYANANTSLWLHHIVFVNLNQEDAVCGRKTFGERFFASGNERTPAEISRMGTVPTGYYIGKEDVIAMLVELMNQSMEKQVAVPVVTFEYIEGFPADFYPSKPVWLDITGCGSSDKTPKTKTTFQYSSPGWTSDFSGSIIGMGGHVHDGGTHLEIFDNGKEVCNCVPSYGQSPGYWDVPGTSMVMPMSPIFSPMSHISSISGCLSPTAVISPGDILHNTAYYNFTEYMPMLNVDGTYADIMGISLIYIAKGMNKTVMESFVGSHVAPLEKTPIPTTVAAMDMTMPNGIGPDMGQMLMTCFPERDSPGTISTKGINMKVRRVAMDFLMAVLNDTCLQVWSNKYVEYFWYGIVAVIALFTLARLLKRNANRQRSLSAPVSKVVGFIRAVSYPQFTPSKVLKVPTSGTIFLVTGYIGFLMALEFINVTTGDDQTYQSMGVRAAWLSVGQVPLIILLANKRNFIELFTAVSYERLNVLHRWTARGLLLTTTLHFGFQSYGWARAGVMQLEWNIDTCPPSGMGAYALVLWMNLSTLAPFRNFCYEFFVVQHILTFLGLIVAIMIHIPPTALYARTYIYIAIGLYLVSRLVQTAIYVYHNVRPSQAQVSAISSNVTKITIPNHKLGTWRSGSFILLSLPRFGLFQSHPATIASTPISQGGDLVFYLHVHKGFTRRITRPSAGIRPHVALIDGPYGGHHADFAAFPAVVLIAASTGITFTLPILLDMAARASASRSLSLPVRTLHFIWVTRDPAFVAALKPDIAITLAALSAAGVAVSVHVHVTSTQEPHSERSETSSNDSRSDIDITRAGSDIDEKDIAVTSSSEVSITSKEAGLAFPVASGRPRVASLLAGAKTAAAGEMGVAVCGPLGLSAEVRRCVAGMAWAGDGVYLHVEGFAL